jgi:hypothetical protein
MNQKMKKTIKTILIGIIVLPLFGLMYDAFNGFHVLKISKSVYGIIIGLMITVLWVMIGEFVSDEITAKDKVSDPLYKRVFYLIILLAWLGIVGFLYWFIFFYFKILNI